MSQWIDDVARILAGAQSRRTALRRIGWGLMAALGGSTVIGGPAPAAAGRDCPPHRKCRERCCDADEVCRDRICVACGGGETNCKNRCVDMSSDPKNCGRCRRDCDKDETCCNGECCKLCCNGVCCPPGCLVCSREGGCRC